jgi:hypothetical protein
MNVVLVCIHNFQDYILTNIKQLIKLKHKEIYVITNHKFFDKFEEYKEKINLIEVEKLKENYDYNSKYAFNYDRNFRDGFFIMTSLRFFYIYEFMRQTQLKDVIHIENDVVLYYNCNILLEKLDKKYLYIPFDTYERNIASIMYIPCDSILKKILDNYDYSKSDMYNFSRSKNIINTFPIGIENKEESDEYQFITKNYSTFQFIFDGAAIGQYLGGVDPRNIHGDTTGFINETCIIKYNQYNFYWKTIDGTNRPFIIINNNHIPIFNLHIHCKNLEKFTI